MRITSSHLSMIRSKYFLHQHRAIGKLDLLHRVFGIGRVVAAEEAGHAHCLEALIPWPNFEELSRRPPMAGAVWKVNFNRWDGVEPNRRMSIWSDPQNNESWPHVPSRFGEIVFVE